MPIRFFKEGEAICEPDGTLRFRVSEGTFVVSFDDDVAEITDTTGFTELPPVHFLTDEEAWEVFDAAARNYLRVSGDEFLRQWDAGKYADPDAQERVMGVAMLIPLVRSGVEDK